MVGGNRKYAHPSVLRSQKSRLVSLSQGEGAKKGIGGVGLGVHQSEKKALQFREWIRRPKQPSRVGKSRQEDASDLKWVDEGIKKKRREEDETLAIRIPSVVLPGPPP